MDRFKAAPKFVAKTDRFMAFTVYDKGLRPNFCVHNHHILSNILGHIEKYQDAQLIISCFLKLEALKGSCPFARQEHAHKDQGEYMHKIKRACHNKKSAQSNLPLLTVPISQIFQST